MGSEQKEGTSMPCSDRKLCANNCGFWGNAATMDLCSKCYKDFCLKEERASSAKAAVKISLNIKPSPKSVKDKTHSKDKTDSSSSTAAVPTPDAAAVVESIAELKGSASEQEQPQPKAKNRCGYCSKKVGLMGFNCKCGTVFCGSHRYPERHNCTFDFKGAGRDAIAKANPVVKADKVERF